MIYQTTWLVPFLLTLVSGEGGDWAYVEHHAGPSKWGNDCQKKAQSPINIETDKVEYKKGLDKPMLVGYDANVGPFAMTNNGHSVSLSLSEPTSAKLQMSLPSVDGTYNLHSFHFHWGTDGTKGSEHTVNSEKYPMEVHFVHVNSKYASLGDALGHDDGLAVLGFFYEETSDNSNYDSIVNNLNAIPEGGNTTSITSLNLANLMLRGVDLGKYYRYQGSLTTPPCSEVITWTVFSVPIKIGKKQMEQFRTALHFDSEMYNNYRPVQPLNGRKVYTSDETLAGSGVSVTSSVILVLTCFLVNLKL